MGADPSWATVGWPYSGRVSPKATMAAIANMTAVAANGLPMLRASPLFNTPMKGMPAPANRDHEAKTKYARIRGLLLPRPRDLVAGVDGSWQTRADMGILPCCWQSRWHRS